MALGAFFVGLFGLYDIGLGACVRLLAPIPEVREAVPNEYSGILLRVF